VRCSIRYNKRDPAHLKTASGRTGWRILLLVVCVGHFIRLEGGWREEESCKKERAIIRLASIMKMTLRGSGYAAADSESAPLPVVECSSNTQPLYAPF